MSSLQISIERRTLRIKYRAQIGPRHNPAPAKRESRARLTRTDVRLLKV